MRLVESPHYSDAALSVYVKVKALAQRPEGCTAGIATLASYLRLSESTVQRGLAQLRVAGHDGIVELPESRRRSLPGGYGTTARRRVRPMAPTERFVWLPVTASECLRPRLLRAFAVITHAVAQKHPLTSRVLAEVLRHHSGRRAGLPLTTGAVTRIVDELDASGWITVHHRAGEHGRHLFKVHDGRSVPGRASRAKGMTVSTAFLDDRSGVRADEGSLAYKEDRRTDRPDDEAAPISPAVGERPVESERQVDEEASVSVTPRPAPGRGGLALRAEGAEPSPARTGGGRTGRPYTGPHLTFSPRLHAVLEPVRFLLEHVNTYVQRRLGREVARQLDDGMSVERLHSRLTQRLAGTAVEDIRDPGRWLLGVALPRWGCADPDCETGTLWSSGRRCRACREAAADRRVPPRNEELAPAPPPSPQAPPSRAGDDRQHRPRRGERHPGLPARTPSEAAGPVVVDRCRGRGGTCSRTAPYGLCWRCRVEAAGTSSAASGPARTK
ncbi:hypothetical protein [Streptomyces viridosporus]|uniref:hypothetical protein n=1 Tax=Streptomyces viridosporus TaxID=67581 RepID=UPI0009C0727E|nr:hypothetical protein [Streptomyces viridosporus]